MPKITKQEVDNNPPKAKRYIVWDTEIKGFGLLVLPTNVKSFVFQYRTKQGRSRRATIGKFGPTLTANQAREKAKDMSELVRNGGDPLKDKETQRDAFTVGQVLDLYMASAKFAEKTPITQANDKGRIKRHLIPTVGRVYMDELKAEDVRRAFGKIRDGKTATDEKTGPRGRAIVRGGEGAARMAIRLLRAAINWAMVEGYAATNPAADVEIGSDGERETVLETAEDYERMFRTLERMENEKRIRPSHADAIRVIALTGARRGEIAGLRWRHVDLKKGLITLTKHEHKTGKRTGKPKIIGLPAAAQAIIARQPEGEPDQLVFRPAKGDKPADLSQVWAKIRTEAALPSGMVLHGLRHSLASMMAEQGAQAVDIMHVLGHRQLSTSQKYVHKAADKRASLAEKAASSISAAINGAKPADVVPIKRGRE